jgi:hypothetical protein
VFAATIDLKRRASGERIAAATNVKLLWRGVASERARCCCTAFGLLLQQHYHIVLLPLLLLLLLLLLIVDHALHPLTKYR